MQLQVLILRAHLTAASDVRELEFSPHTRVLFREGFFSGLYIPPLFKYSTFLITLRYAYTL